MTFPIIRWATIVLCCTAIAAQDLELSQPVDVPDEIGMGERLALVAWLKENKVTVADPNDLPALRLAYLRLAHPERLAEPAEDPTEPLRLALWRRYNVNAKPGQSVEELRARLAALDAVAKAADADVETIRRNEAESAKDERRRAAATRSSASTQVGSSPTSGHESIVLGSGPADRPLGDGEYAATYRMLRRTSVEIFAAGPRVGKPWAASAIAYLEDFAIVASHAMGPSAYDRKLFDRGRVLYEAGCDDPMVLHAYANQFSYTAKGEKAVRRKALDGFAGSAYPAFRTYLCAEGYIPFVMIQPTSADARYAMGILIESARQMMHEKTDDPIQRQFVARLLNDGISDQLPCFAELREALIKEMATGAVDPWLTQMVQGYLEVAEAWRARGSDWASSVNQKGWDGLHAHLLSAQRHFEKAWEMEPRLACAPIEMINVVMGQGGSTADKLYWFERATQVSPECADAYSYIFNALSPQWGGSPADILAIGLRALETGKFSGEVPNYYLKALEAGAGNGHITADKTPDPFADPGVWNHISTVMEGYLAAPAYAGLRTWNLQRYARYAYRCNQRETFVRLINELGGVDKLSQVVGQDATPDAMRYVAGQPRFNDMDDDTLAQIALDDPDATKRHEAAHILAGRTGKATYRDAKGVICKWKW